MGKGFNQTRNGNDRRKNNSYKIVHLYSREIEKIMKDQRYESGDALDPELLIMQHEALVFLYNKLVVKETELKTHNSLREVTDIYYNISTVKKMIQKNIEFVEMKQKMFMSDRKVG